MTAKDNLFAICQADGATVANQYGSTTIERERIGLIDLPSGTIVMTNPTVRDGAEDIRRRAFAISATPGIYPVDVYTFVEDGRRQIAFASICFSDKAPTSFIAAKTVCDIETPRRGFCGYVVRDCTTGFMDAATYKSICALPRYKSAWHYSELEELAEDNAERKGVYCAVGKSEEGLSAAIFRIQKSGVYYWYWGVRSGSPCCLIADFFTFT